MRVKYRALACLGCSCSLLLLTTTIVFASLFGWTNSLREEGDCAKIKDRLVWVPLFAQPSNYDFIRIYKDGVFTDEYIGPKNKCEKYWQRSTQRRRLQDDNSAVPAGIDADIFLGCLASDRVNEAMQECLDATAGAGGYRECQADFYVQKFFLQCLCDNDSGHPMCMCRTLRATCYVAGQPIRL